MATVSAQLVRFEDPTEVAERLAVAGFLAGYTGNTRVSYKTDLRIFAAWCHENRLPLLGTRRVHLEEVAALAKVGVDDPYGAEDLVAAGVDDAGAVGDGGVAHPGGRRRGRYR